MNPTGTKTLVFVSGGVLVGLALLSGKGDTFRRVWAAALWTTLLAAVADLAPQVIGPFALLVIVAAVATDPGAIGKFLGGNSTDANTSAKPAATTSYFGNVFGSSPGNVGAGLASAQASNDRAAGSGG